MIEDMIRFFVIKMLVLFNKSIYRYLSGSKSESEQSDSTSLSLEVSLSTVLRTLRSSWYLLSNTLVCEAISFACSKSMSLILACFGVSGLV